MVNALAAQNLITPVGTEKIGKFEYIVSLNDAPQEIAELNDLPIKKVNGTLVYIRDVAFVHDGAPPQTNVVRVDGSHAVLMTILKSGSASTLDVINGIKALLPKIKEVAAEEPGAARGRRPVGVRQRRGIRRDPRRRDRRGADRADDPAVPGQLAIDADHHDLDPARHPGLDHHCCRCWARPST